MEKELIFPISIIILMIVCIGVTVSVDLFNHENEIMVDSFYFPIPEGYIEGTINNLGSINYTNGNNSIFISEDDNLNVEDKINSYKSHNPNITVEKYVVNDIPIKLVNTNNANITHYFFVKDNRGYDVYTWDGNDDLKDVVDNFVSN